MLITPTLLRTVTTEALADIWSEPLSDTCEEFGIDTPYRIAGFISNIAHESGGLRTVKENLYYSADGLMKVFGKYFPTLELAKAYAMQPEKIANKVYANRMGNGDEASGDGYKFSGKGLIQLTGKNNFLAYSLSCNNEALQYPQIVELPKYAAESAGWFWHSNGLNALADAEDVTGMCRRINGGLNGLADRQLKYTQIMNYLWGTPSR